MSTFWSIWISACVIIVIGGCTWLLLANRKVEVRGEEAESGEVPTTGHIYDGIEEYDNPLPAWWFKSFLGTVIFGIAYFIWFPGMGAWEGAAKYFSDDGKAWTQEVQWERQVAAADEKYGPVFEQFHNTPISELVNNPDALKMASRLFANNCSTCHGTAAQGSYGFPNLTDKDWLYGGEPETIKATITHGRKGAMPAWGEVIGEQGVLDVTEYVLSLSGLEHNEEQVAAGAEVFKATCTTCHGADGKGMKELGAPNLTDDIWLYKSPRFSLRESIRHSVRNGRSGNMPAQQDQLTPAKIHLLATYVYSLSLEE